jgi:acetolactate synthase-1/2/3 large subunit
MNWEWILKYSDYFLDTLVEMGYTHCFFLSGGNILHLLESASSRFNCVAVINEVSAVIAADYFNVSTRTSNKKAFVLITAGPGLTNAVTGIAGAWLENREVLIVGGQSRSNMLSNVGLKQLGHQEIGGVMLVNSITKFSHSMSTPLDQKSIKKIADISKKDPKGPVFIEICLDVSALETDNVDLLEIEYSQPESVFNSDSWQHDLGEKLLKAERPIILIGAGVNYQVFSSLLRDLEESNVPIATSWNAADYLDFDSEIYGGRPGAYGMRWSNMIIQQSDLVITLGTRFSFWETGFNWDEFAPLADIWSFNIDQFELSKPGPYISRAIVSDLSEDFPTIVKIIASKSQEKWRDWVDFVKEVKALLPVSEIANNQFDVLCNPFEVVNEIANKLLKNDLVISCSSGGAYTTLMQGFKQKRGQLLTNSRGLSSMGYGLAGAIGTSMAHPQKRVILFEGDGGFLQNLSEVSTILLNNLNIKIFIFVNNGYASIRLSQKVNFDGHYIGCDVQTGVAIPDLNEILLAFGLPVLEIKNVDSRDKLKEILDIDGPAVGLIYIHPDQPYFPKILSRISSSGEIESNPIHLMYPELSSDIFEIVMKYPRALNKNKKNV